MGWPLMAGHALVTESRPGHRARLAARNSAAWERSYLRWAVADDFACALLASTLAAGTMYQGDGYLPASYFVLTAGLPALWVATTALAGGYDPRFIGVGSDEFRRILNAAVSLTAGVAIVSYALKLDLARGYVAVAMPCLTTFALVSRYWLRKHLHRQRRRGRFMRRVVAAGHPAAVASLSHFLLRENHHGMTVVGACLAGPGMLREIPGVPVYGGIEDVPAAVDEFGADSVAVLSCPEMSGPWLRMLAWELEKTGTELCVAPTLLDVAGPRTTIRPVAGLPLLHLDHAELTGAKWAVKSMFDRLTAGLALLVLAPVFAAIALAIVTDDRGPVFFCQVRIGKDGVPFRMRKFRSMVVDAERRLAQLSAQNEGAGVLFKMRNDPRVTKVGAWLRRWSLDELPQLINVLMGDMSLVGPRPALPQEAAGYEDQMRRRLVVKPGITGLWQVSGRSSLQWEDVVRLDLRYVENWSLALDLQILWKTWAAVVHGSGAY
jgi:exopolysaccharide biosynthesis polyprenyl glycosylphosphotransferase